ncbi:MAG: 16S rRNA (cytidine(1402)-2'-O)-methyltransferase [Saccharofermentans sp.]|nr:16S rRNA (cytidine(1402)-2'-O)-methyltransferase [Saccharofermentans sp.]
MLYLVGTPIGNMGDFSSRAQEVLSSVDIIACEDTRRTGLLLQNFGIENKLFSYHEHNKFSKGPVLIDMMKQGLDVALVSDAGMPSINDPGEDLVKLAIENDLDVTAVPGPVAAITALVLSGLDTTKFHYEGFLPSEGSPRKKRLEALTKFEETVIIYEAPHRLMKLISELQKYGFGSSKAAFCRELTKKYEQVLRVTIDEAYEYFTQTPPKGEFVICLSPLPQKQGEDISEEDLDVLIREMSDKGMSTKDIAKDIASKTGRNKKEIYAYIVNLLQ